MIKVDGSLGEGGGQVLRSALTLSLMTGKKVKIYNIRANRPNPGLRHQHLCAVKAAQKIGKGDVIGGDLGSTSLEFHPFTIQPGRFQFNIKTAGATTLVLQTIFLPLSRAATESSLRITGGTHVPWSPSYHYLKMQWLPFMERLGFNTQISLDLAGFYPKGGGQIQAKIKPLETIKSLTINERGSLKHIRGISAVANLNRRIAERQRSQVVRRLGEKYRLNDIRIKQMPSKFKGTLILLLAEFEKSQGCYFSLGKPGKPAEHVADDAINALESFMVTDGCVDEYLADQLLLPLAFASGISIFKSAKITHHLITNSEVIKKFIDVQIEIFGHLGQPGLVTITPDQRNG
jgi:RNA 3'-terminal phosphate cyclase (ATP)